MAYDELKYGMGFRQPSPLRSNIGTQAPYPQGDSLPPEQGGDGGLAPDAEALIQAMLAQQQGSRADRIRSNIRMPTENKNLIATGFDLWRADRAEKKGVEQMREALSMQGKAQKEAQERDMASKAAELKAKAAAAYKFMKSQGAPEEQALAVGDAVAAGIVDIKDLIGEGKAPQREKVKEVGPDGVEREYFIDSVTGEKWGDERVTALPKGPKATSEKDRFTIADNLWEDFEPAFNEYNQAFTNIGTMRKLVNDVSTGAADVAVLYSFIKNLDPESVVREGEVALSQQAISAVQKLRNLGEKLEKGRMFTDQFKKDILEASEILYGELEGGAGRAFQNAVSRAEAVGVSPELAYGKFAIEQMGKLGQSKDVSRGTPPPPPGAVIVRE